MWPPVVLLNEGEGVIVTRVTGEFRVMTPLKNLGPDGAGHKKTVWWAVNWVGLALLRLLDDDLDLPDSCSDHTGRRENRL